ncbi:uncharacterized protein LOC112093784 [Morus notabilis]|uniref:uncharacterized protein LOC112093784 n=1 Tax=Morus notabilis TaxID=981085 RepID=UPI000CECFAC3|nr:uncharacterized protein LOC112093784 [Morus notabilis]
MNHQFAKFLEVFKKLHINIPFAEALAQMPTYMKFMMDILSKKRTLENFEIVTLTEEFFQRLGLGEPKVTTVLFQMADHSIKYSWGILEDVSVKVDKLIFPANFIVLDMEEDQDIPLILGRPFLVTGNAVINVLKGELSLEVENEKVTFNVFSLLKGPRESETCCRMDNIKKTMCEKNSVKVPK